MRTLRIAVLLGLLAAPAWGLGPGQPASAHSAAQPIPDAAYYETALTSTAPALRGVRARVDPRGEWIEVSSSAAGPVVVLGYLREPYLRITAAGTEENQLSQSALINKSLFGDPAAPGQSSVAPAWKRISAQRAVRWHDHRIHWMGGAQPPAVVADPVHPHLVGDWTVHLLAGTTPVTVSGSLRWTGKPAASPGLTVRSVVATNVLLAVLMAAVVVALRLRRRTRTGEPAELAPASTVDVR
jgi:hypothetical protein